MESNATIIQVLQQLLSQHLDNQKLSEHTTQSDGWLDIQADYEHYKYHIHKGPGSPLAYDRWLRKNYEVPKRIVIK